MQSLAGTFLIARTTLKDQHFARTVVLILQHGPDGAFGLILNRPEYNKELPFPVFIGGPCKFQGLILLHGQKDWVENVEQDSAEICPGVYLGDAECLKRVADLPPGQDWRFRVFSGYSGWAPGQLEGELAQGSWAVVPARAPFIFDVPLDQVWLKLVPSAIPEPSLN